MLPGWKVVKRLNPQLETFLLCASACVINQKALNVVCVGNKQHSELLEESKIKIWEGCDGRVRKASVAMHNVRAQEKPCEEGE